MVRKALLVLLNDFQRQWENIRDDALAAFEEVGRSGRYVLGREVAAFEESLAAAWDRPYAVGVASGLDALEISLAALGCGPGDKVLTTPLSAFASTLAILKLRAVPVFVDTDDFGLIDLDRCRSVLRARSDIRFLLPVHLYGHALDMRRLRALGDECGCLIVEDCAQSIGASHNGVPTGAAGRMAATSFYPTKNLGALGDGGAILTGDLNLARTARTLRDYGQSAKYRHELVGYNSRLDELQAGLLRRVFLPRLASWQEKRRRIAPRYAEGIRNPNLRMMGAPQGSDSCWHLFPVLAEADRKADFMAWLESRGIGRGEHYPCAIPDQPAMAGVPFESAGPLDTARRICRSEVSLPIHAYLQDGEIARVINACNGWRG
jgi:dTDP-3-amino-3,4,6-trideoxy-alpha-D-glucose transaminase